MLDEILPVRIEYLKYLFKVFEAKLNDYSHIPFKIIIKNSQHASCIFRQNIFSNCIFHQNRNFFAFKTESTPVELFFDNTFTF